MNRSFLLWGNHLTIPTHMKRKRHTKKLGKIMSPRYLKKYTEMLQNAQKGLIFQNFPGGGPPNPPSGRGSPSHTLPAVGCADCLAHIACFKVS